MLARALPSPPARAVYPRCAPATRSTTPRASAGALTAAACALAACGATPTVLEPPSDIVGRYDFMAAVGLDADGNPIATSGIAAVGDHTALTVDDPRALAAVDLLLWRAADLPGMDSADRARAREVPLAVATQCDAVLAPPASARRIDGSGEATAGALRWVSTAVRSAACLPGWSRDVSVDVRCVSLPCAATVIERGCEAEVALASCMTDRFIVSARVGAPCARRLGDACEASALEHAGTLLECRGAEDCALRFYTRRDGAWATVERTAVLDVSPQPPSDIATLGIRSLHRFSGYLGPVAVVGDRVAVVTHAGRYHDRQECPSSAPSELRWYDRQARLVATATAPGCLRPLVALPGEGRAIGAYLTPPPSREVWIVEVAREGGVTRRRAVEGLAGQQANALSEGLLLPTGQVVIAEASDGTTPGHLLVVDPATLLARVVPTVDTNLTALAFDGRDVVVAADGQDAVLWMNAESDALTGSALVTGSGSKSIGDLEVDTTADVAWLALPLEEPSIQVYRRRQVGPRIRVFEDAWQPTTLVRAGRGVGQVYVSSVLLDRAEGVYRAALSRTSLAEDGVRPGTVPLGFGPLGQHDRDADGVVWATLPWAGELVRITVDESAP